MAKSTKHITSSDAGKDSSFFSGTDLAPTYHDIDWSSDDWDNMFKGTDYWDLYQANPYANVSFEQTFWDKIGLSNKYDDNVLANQLAYNEYNASLAQKMYDENFAKKQLADEREYNSPINQVKLQKQAGLNPDLTGGVSFSPSGSVSPASQSPISSPVFESTNPLNQIQGAISLLTSSLGIAQSVVDGYFGVSNSIVDAANRDINLLSSADTTAKEIIQGMPELFTESKRSLSSSDIRAAISFSGLKNRRAQRYVTDALHRAISNPEVYSRYRAAQLRGVQDDLDFFKFSGDDSYLNAYMKALGELMALSYKASLGASKSQSDYNKSYYDTKDGKAIATLENTTADADTIKKEIDGIMNDAYRSIGKQSAQDRNPVGVILFYLLKNLVLGK